MTKEDYHKFNDEFIKIITNLTMSLLRDTKLNYHKVRI